MAAHVYTALIQLHDEYILREDHVVNWPGLQAALDYSCWTELLDLDDYKSLAEIVQVRNPRMLACWIGSVMEKYKKEWEDLDKPRDKEQWVDREYEKYVVNKGA